MWSVHSTTLIGGYGPIPVARSGTKLLAGTMSYLGVALGKGNGELYEIDLATGAVVKIVYKPGNNSFAPFCDDGIALTDCSTPQYQGYYGNGYVEFGARDDYSGKWLLKMHNHDRVVSFGSAGTMGTLTTLPRISHRMTYRRNADLSVNVVYNCGTDSRLYKYDINTSTETALTFSVPGMSGPTSGTLTYSEARDSLIFGVTVNGAHAVVEWVAP